MLMALTYKTFCIFPYVRDFKLLLFVYLIDVSSPSGTQFQLSMINFATEFITQVHAIFFRSYIFKIFEDAYLVTCANINNICMQ